MKIGELIAVARECKGWSLRDMEKQTGISNALLSQIETGHIKSPSWRNVVKIAKALNLKLERLAACDEEASMSIPRAVWTCPVCGFDTDFPKSPHPCPIKGCPHQGCFDPKTRPVDRQT